MADKVAFNVDLSKLADYTYVEGVGTSTLLKMDGYYSVAVVKLTEGTTASGNHKFIANLTVQDADEKGASLIADILVSGTDKNGKSNIRQFGDFLSSLGFTQEQIRGLAANGQASGAALAQQLAGRTGYANVERNSYDGKTYSRVNGWITQQKYEDAVAANAHRKLPRAEATFSAPSVGMPAMPAMPNMGAMPAIAQNVPSPQALFAGIQLPGAQQAPAASVPMTPGNGVAAGQLAAQGGDPLAKLRGILPTM
jgi:hypothetical protein